MKMVARGTDGARGGVTPRRFRPATVDQAARELSCARLVIRQNVATLVGCMHKSLRQGCDAHAGQWQGSG